MRRKSFAFVCVLVAAFASIALALAGCAAGTKTPALSPKVSPPTIGEAGVLRVGVDLSYPPFAGQENGQKVGIDVDVASAIAERLGLRVSLSEVKPSDAATALADGTVDIVMSVPLEQAATGAIAYGGSYINDAPAFFARVDTRSVEPSISLQSITKQSIGAQDGSPAFWYLQDQLGEDSVKGYSTLREPFDLVAKGKLKLAAGDAIIGAYIARDYANVRMVGQIKPASLIGIATRRDNTRLQEIIGSQLDTLATDGVLAMIRSKWVGNLRKLTLPAGVEETRTP